LAWLKEFSLCASAVAALSLMNGIGVFSPTSWSDLKYENGKKQQ